MDTVIIEILKTYGLAGLGMAFFAYLCFDMNKTIKNLHKQMAEKDKIFAIKIEQHLEDLSGDVHEVQSDAAKVGGMVQAQQMRRR